MTTTARPAPPSTVAELLVWSRPLLTGHRGAAAYERENSLASFARAVAMGADVLECDVRQTRDGALVLAHDEIAGKGRQATRIANATLASLRRRTGRDDLLTLDLLLPQVRAWGVLLNVDLKARNAEVPVVATLAAHAMIERTVITSRASYQLRRLRALAPGLRLGLSKGSSPPRGPHGVPEWSALVTQRELLPRTLPATLRRARADAAYLQHHLITLPLVAALHRAGFGCYAWTVDAPARAAQLAAWGVDGITTNCPDLIRPLIGSRQQTVKFGDDGG